MEPRRSFEAAAARLKGPAGPLRNPGASGESAENCLLQLEITGLRVVPRVSQDKSSPGLPYLCGGRAPQTAAWGQGFSFVCGGQSFLGSFGKSILFPFQASGLAGGYLMRDFAFYSRNIGITNHLGRAGLSLSVFQGQLLFVVRDGRNFLNVPRGTFTRHKSCQRPAPPHDCRRNSQGLLYRRPKAIKFEPDGKKLSPSSLADCLVWTETFLPARTLRFPLPVFPASFGFCPLSCLGASPSLFHVEHLQNPSKHHTITSPP